MGVGFGRSRGIIEPPPRARLVDFAGAKFDADDLSRAEAAIAKVVTRYPNQLPDEITKLVAAWDAAPEHLTPKVVGPIFTVAHDLAGYGATFGYPLITIFGRSLSRLLTTGDLTREQMTAVVEAHIATLRVIVRDKMSGTGGPIGLQLAATLDQAIAKFHLAAGTERKARLHDEVAALQAKQRRPVAVPAAQAKSGPIKK
jgi:pimeloyl-ACP methyl ester carboxylesterase